MRRPAALLAASAVLALSLAACASDADPQPSATTAPSESSAAPSTPAEDATPAEALLPQFTDVLAANDVAGAPDGEALVAALVEAGFDAAAIERAEDIDEQGLPVRHMAVAVLVEGECLLGQVGDGTPTAIVVAAMADGGCLVAPVAP